MVTANKYNGKYLVQAVSIPNTMALTHVDVLLAHHTKLCVYSLQNVLLLAQMFQVCVTMEQQAAGS